MKIKEVKQRFAVVVALVVLKHVSSYYSEKDIKNLYSILHTKEKTIMKIMEEPKSDEGKILMDALDKYNEKLTQLVSIIREDNATFEEARQFCDNGGPKFLKLKHDNELLKEVLNWTENSLEEMYYMTGATEVLWWELRHLDPKSATYSKIDNFTKDEISFLHQMDKENRLNEFEEFTKLEDFKRTDVPFTSF